MPVTLANQKSVGKSLESGLAKPISAQVASHGLFIRSETEQPATTLGRYVPLLVWAAVLITLLFIPLKIISYGFLAPGDARRHVAKAFTDKPYTEIIVMRPEYKMDHS